MGSKQQFQYKIVVLRTKNIMHYYYTKHPRFSNSSINSSEKNMNEFSKSLQRKINEGKAKVYPHGDSKIKPLLTLADKLNSINDLEELHGFANRRSVLQIDLPKWTEEERKAILWRKTELMKDKRR